MQQYIKHKCRLMNTMINDSQIVETFAKQFVKKTFRDRFMHEAIKKPGALHRRICHEISKVFDETYKGENASLENEDICLFLGWFSPIIHISWKEAKEKMSGGGGGYLVIKADGSRFYAETEAYPAVIYSGQAGK